MFKNKPIRRGFLAGLASLALLVTACDSGSPDSRDAGNEAGHGNVDEMGTEHTNGTVDPSPAAEVAPRRAVVSERLPYAEVNEELVYGYFVFPADMVDPLPAIIVVHEWWGLNDDVRATADRLAGEGYIVLAVDLFAGKSATYAEQARQLMLGVVENPEQAEDNIEQAIEFVNATAGAPRTGSLGWGFGGGWSLNAAMLFPEDIDAAAIYYGQVTEDDDRLRVINAPILGLFGADDKRITVHSVQAFEAALERLRKNHEVHIYPGADHAFASRSGRAYNAEAAEDAWRRTLEFLDLHLAIGTGDDS